MTALINRRIAAALLLGFASGLPLALGGATLQAWMTTEGASIKSIAWFTLAGLPYTWKFLWAPAMDRYAPPGLGRRRGWMVLLQMALALILGLMAVTAVPQDLPRLAALAILLTFLSASQDIVVDAWKSEVMRPAERGLGASAGVLGYRLAMLASGAGALILAGHFGFRTIYLGMAGLTLLLPLISWWAPEREGAAVRPPGNLEEAVLGPLRDFFGRRSAWLFLALVVAYKLSDAFQLALSSTFLLRGVGFSLAEVGWVNKVVGMIAVLAGVTAGGVGLARVGLVRALLVFGVLQALTGLGFMALALRGHDFMLMVLAVMLENFTSGMGTAAFAALLMSLCSVRYAATQYAVLSALAAAGRVYVGPASGALVETLGWPSFFAFTVVTGVPGLLLVWWLRGRITQIEIQGAPA